MEVLKNTRIFLWLIVPLFALFVSSQGACKTTSFVSLDNTKVLLYHSYKSFPTHQSDFCSGLCYMDDRCISCNYDTQRKVCNLSNSDDVMHPEHMVDVPNAIYLKAENSCNCKGNSFCGYVPEFQDFKCLCKFGFTGANCDAGLNLVAVYPLTARHQAQPLQSGPKQGVISNVKCTDEGNDKIQGYCEFAGVKNSYIEIPNQVDGALDLKGSMTILLYINAQTTGLLLQYNANRWGLHIFFITPNIFFARLMIRSNLGVVLPNLQSPIPLGEWKFGGYTYDASTGVNTLWVDGQVVHTYNISIHEVATQFEVRLGANNFDSRHFRGKIACVQFYRRVLTAQQIREAGRLCRYLT